MTGRGVLMMVLACGLVGGLVLGCAPDSVPTTPTTPTAPTVPTTPTSPTTPTAPADEVINWKMQTHLVPNHSEHLQVIKMADAIRVATAGRLDIEVYSTGELVPTANMMDAIEEGVLEFGMAWPGYFAGIEPSLVIYAGLPYGLKTLEEYIWLIKYGGFEDLLREIVAKHGVHVVELGVACPYGELSSKVPIRKVEDFQGVKIRSYGEYSQIFDHFGARSVTMAAGEIYTGMATGTIDAAIWGGPKLHHDLKLHEVAKYWITPPMASFIGNMVMVNPKEWNALPADIQEMLKSIVFEYHLQYPIETQYLDALALEDMVENWDVEVCTLPPEETAKLQAFAESRWDVLATTDDYSARAIGIFKDLMALKGYI